MLCFKVEHFDTAYNTLTKFYNLPTDGGVIETERGKMGTVMGLEGETICIHNLEESKYEILSQDSS